MTKRDRFADEYRLSIITVAEGYGFTEADVQRVVERLGRYPTIKELEAAAGRLVARILMDGHSAS